MWGQTQHQICPHLLSSRQQTRCCLQGRASRSGRWSATRLLTAPSTTSCHLSMVIASPHPQTSQPNDRRWGTWWWHRSSCCSSAPPCSLPSRMLQKEALSFSIHPSLPGPGQSGVWGWAKRGGGEGTVSWQFYLPHEPSYTVTVWKCMHLMP